MNPSASPESQSVPKPEPDIRLLPKILRFDDLANDVGGGAQVWIENHGQIYRLRRTRQGKLILTK